MQPEDKAERQSFLGEHSHLIFESVRVGIVGLGGGGSHVVQQLAHIGFRNYALIDPDVVELRNLNRLVGATRTDAEQARPKIEVARRVILGLEPTASIEARKLRWQDAADLVKGCDVVIGCVDGYSERAQLEGQARRYLIPYIDIGMDVFETQSGAHCIAGQVILSMPGGPCMTCMQFITEQKLSQEAARYGAAGGRPQVVWPNGILASAAVGIVVDLLTDWTGLLRSPVYHAFDGSRLLMNRHPRLAVCQESCSHYPLSLVGDPILKRI